MQVKSYISQVGLSNATEGSRESFKIWQSKDAKNFSPTGCSTLCCSSSNMMQTFNPLIGIFPRPLILLKPKIPTMQFQFLTSQPQCSIFVTLRN